MVTTSWKRKLQRDPSKRQGVKLNNFPKVEDILQLIFILTDFDLVDGELIGKLARRIGQRYDKSSFYVKITMLHQQHQRTTQSVPMQYLCYILFSQLAIQKDIWFNAVNA